MSGNNVSDQPYRVQATGQARRDMEQLPEAVAAACFEFVAGALAAAPRRVGKPLTGPLQGRYSARRGSYRVVYRILETDHVVQVLHVDHRGTVYRR